MKLIVIEGLVLPSGWDVNGNIIDISLSTFNEDSFLIEQNSIGKKLLDHIREEVEVTGALKTVNRRQVIEIREYRVKNAVSSLSR